MKRILIGLLAFSLFSCTKDAGLSYADKDAVYFQYSYKQYQTVINYDNIVFSFGMKGDEVQIDTAKIVVKLMGNVSDKDRHYAVRVFQDSTTAVAGVHYEAIAPLQVFHANKLQDTLRVIVKRSALNSSHISKEEKAIKLEIIDAEDFAVGANKGQFMKLRLNNYLSEPKWWESYERSGLYYYHPEKWKVLMKFHDDFKKTGSQQPINVNMVTPYFSALRSYLANIPTYDKETNQRILIDRLVD